MTLVKDNAWSDSHYDDNEDYTHSWDSFFVLEPGLMVEMNLVKWMRLNGGISYRYAPGVAMASLPNSFNNFSGIVTLKFGKF